MIMSISHANCVYSSLRQLFSFSEKIRTDKYRKMLTILIQISMLYNKNQFWSKNFGSKIPTLTLTNKFDFNHSNTNNK